MLGRTWLCFKPVRLTRMRNGCDAIVGLEKQLITPQGSKLNTFDRILFLNTQWLAAGLPTL